MEEIRKKARMKADKRIARAVAKSTETVRRELEEECHAKWEAVKAEKEERMRRELEEESHAKWEAIKAEKEEQIRQELEDESHEQREMKAQIEMEVREGIRKESMRLEKEYEERRSAERESDKREIWKEVAVEIEEGLDLVAKRTREATERMEEQCAVRTELVNAMLIGEREALREEGRNEMRAMKETELLALEMKVRMTEDRSVREMELLASSERTARLSTEMWKLQNRVWQASLADRGEVAEVTEQLRELRSDLADKMDCLAERRRIEDERWNSRLEVREMLRRMDRVDRLLGPGN